MRALRPNRAQDPIPLHPSELEGVPLWVRPGTTDVGTIVHDFSRREHIPPSDRWPIELAVELGTNVGTAIAGLACLHPRATIIGVEPDPGNAALARRNASPFGERCVIVEAAIWDRPTRIVLEGEHPSGYEASEQPAGAEGERLIDAMTIDDLLEQHAPGRPVDYLIFNLEGAEDRVLVGGGEWASRTRMIRTELHPTKGFGEERCLELLRRYGFEAWTEQTPWGGWGFGIKELDG